MPVPLLPKVLRRTWEPLSRGAQVMGELDGVSMTGKREGRMRERIGTVFQKTKYRWWMVVCVVIGVVGGVVAFTLHPVGMVGVLVAVGIFYLAACKGRTAAREAVTGRSNDWPYGTDDR